MANSVRRIDYEQYKALLELDIPVYGDFRSDVDPRYHLDAFDIKMERRWHRDYVKYTYVADPPEKMYWYTLVDEESSECSEREDDGNVEADN